MRKNKIRKVKLLVLDVDGVLTDGKIIYDSAGKETKMFDVQDGYGLVLFKRLGFKTAILTARGSPVVRMRARDLKMDKVYLNAFPKLESFRKLQKDFNVKPEEICFMGDDFPDIPVLRKAGFSVAVKNARPEVKKIADYVTKKNGGEGAVREVVELILKSQGKWKRALSIGT